MCELIDRWRRTCSVALAVAATLLVAACASSQDTQEGVRPEANTLTQNWWVPDSADPVGGPQCGDIDDKLAGTFEGTGTAVGLIAGARWGRAILTLTNGETYPLNYTGFKLLDVSASGVEFTGRVYNLSRIEDLVGTYYGAGGNLGLVAGEGEVILNNSRCVVITARSKSSGVQLSPPGPGGFTVQLAPEL